MGTLYQKAQPSRGDAVPGHSLNSGARKREMMRISHENEVLEHSEYFLCVFQCMIMNCCIIYQAMLQRIMLRKSNYRCVDWLEDRKVQEGILCNIKKVRPDKFESKPETLLQKEDRIREERSKIEEKLSKAAANVGES